MEKAYGLAGGTIYSQHKDTKCYSATVVACGAAQWAGHGTVPGQVTATCPLRLDL